MFVTWQLCRSTRFNSNSVMHCFFNTPSLDCTVVHPALPSGRTAALFVPPFCWRWRRSAELRWAVEETLLSGAPIHSLVYQLDSVTSKERWGWVEGGWGGIIIKLLKITTVLNCVVLPKHGEYPITSEVTFSFQTKLVDSVLSDFT